MKEVSVLKLIILLTISLSSLTFAKAPSTYFQVRNLISKTSQNEFIRTLNQFVKASSPSRMIGKPGHDNAVSFITDTIKAFDPKSTGKTTVDKFTPDISEAKNFYSRTSDRRSSHLKKAAQKFSSLPGTNIIWEKEGLNPDKLLVVTAHYDTISLDNTTSQISENAAMPGANYNASGIAVALNLIKALAQSDLNYTVQVVFLDWQGIALLGSHHHAKELKKNKKDVLGFINLERLGQDTSFLDKTKQTGNMIVHCRPQDEKFISGLNQHGLKMTSTVTFTPKMIELKDSDSHRFWEQGLQGGTFTQNIEDDFNPKFHQTPQDTPETLNHRTLYNGYLYIGGAVLGTLLDISK